MKLSLLSTVGGVDPLPLTLGRKLTPTPKSVAAVAWREVAPGVTEVDGKMSTNILANYADSAVMHDYNSRLARKRRSMLELTRKTENYFNGVLPKFEATEVPSFAAEFEAHEYTLFEGARMSREFLRDHAHKSYVQEGCGICLVLEVWGFEVTRMAGSKPRKGQSLLDWLRESSFDRTWGVF